MKCFLFCSKDLILSGGDDTNPNPIFPIAPQWVDNLIYIGREIIGVEYLKEKDEDLTDVNIINSKILISTFILFSIKPNSFNQDFFLSSSLAFSFA